MRVLQVMQSTVKQGVGKSGKPYKALVVKGAVIDTATSEMRMVDDMVFLPGDDIKPLAAGKYEVVPELRVRDGHIELAIAAFLPIKSQQP